GAPARALQGLGRDADREARALGARRLEGDEEEGAHNPRAAGPQATGIAGAADRATGFARRAASALRADGRERNEPDAQPGGRGSRRAAHARPMIAPRARVPGQGPRTREGVAPPRRASAARVRRRLVLELTA